MHRYNILILITLLMLISCSDSDKEDLEEGVTTKIDINEDKGEDQSINDQFMVEEEVRSDRTEEEKLPLRLPKSPEDELTKKEGCQIPNDLSKEDKQDKEKILEDETEDKSDALPLSEAISKSNEPDNEAEKLSNSEKDKDDSSITADKMKTIEEQEVDNVNENTLNAIKSEPENKQEDKENNSSSENKDKEEGDLKAQPEKALEDTSGINSIEEKAANEEKLKTLKEESASSASDLNPNIVPVSTAEGNKEAEKIVETPKTGLEVNENDITLGNMNSNVIIMEYVALTCTHCAHYHLEVFPKIKEKYIDTDKIGYVVRLFVTNKVDLEGAALAYCADKEKFLTFLDILFKQQNNWVYASNSSRQSMLTNIGGMGGIPAEQYAKKIEDSEMIEMCAKNAKAVIKSPKFVGTPAFFINGVQYHGLYSIDALSSVIDKELKNGKKADT